VKIVAISGWAKSGKDTAAKILISDYGFNRVAFADPLKNTVADQFNFERNSLDTQALKEAPILTMRVEPKDPFTRMLSEFMIKEFRTLGGKQCHEFVYTKFEGDKEPQFVGICGDGENMWPEPVFWTRRSLMMLEGSSKRATNPNYWVEKAIKTARAQNKEYIVISDLRYRNEIYAVKMALGGADSLTTVRINRFDDSPSGDPSERDLDQAEFDVVIENRGSIDDFYGDVNELAKSLGIPRK
jgi:hypothetical protein